MKRISLRQFARLVRDALRELPGDFAPYMENVVVDVADWPTDEQLLDAGLTEDEIEAGETVLGLFDSNPLELPDFAGDVIDTSNSARRIWVFREPHLLEFADPDELARQVRKTVIHEVAHHFGLTDDDLARWTTVY